MELEGLVRALNFLIDSQVQIGTIITDRHKQINKYLRQKHPGIEHRYDVWHISKGTIQYLDVTVNKMAELTGVKKKLARLAAASECGIVGEWTKSIINHLYWCAASVTNDDDAPDDASDDDDDNGNDIVKHWKSLMDHLCNIHDDCYHAELSTLNARRKKWLIPGIFVK